MKTLQVKLIYLSLLTALSIMLMNPLSAQDITPFNPGISQPGISQPGVNPISEPYQIATSYQEYQQLFHNKNINIVRSKQDMRRYIEKNQFLSKRMKGVVRFQFVQAMRFGDKGLITFKYGMLKDNLSKKEFDLAMELIYEGLGWDIPETGVDYQDYHCADTGTCEKKMNCICIGENCK